MADIKNSFIVYANDIKETLDSLTDDQVGELFRGMVDYQVTGEDPNFSGVLKFAFIPIRQQMDRDNTKWEQTKEKRAKSGRLGGIRSGEVRKEKSANEANEASASKTKQNEANKANEAVNVNVNVNDNVNGNVNVSDGFEAATDDPSSLSSLLISHLNETAGTNYNVTAAVTERVAELVEAGYTEADMKRVIDSKVSEWKGSDKMRGYLRPRTLFGDKFEEYASAPVPMEVEKSQEQKEMVTRLKRQRSEKAEDLASIVRSLEDLRNSSGGIRGNPDEWQRLKDQEALTEDAISHIDARLEKLGG